MSQLTDQDVMALLENGDPLDAAAQAHFDNSPECQSYAKLLEQLETGGWNPYEARMLDSAEKQRLTKQITPQVQLSAKASTPSIGWATLAGGIALLVVVGLVALLLSNRLGQTVRPQELPIGEVVPPQEDVLTSSSNFYDGWAAGHSFSFADDMPLRQIDTDNDGMFSIFASPDLNIDDGPPTLEEPNQIFGMLIFSEIFASPGGEPISAESWVTRLNQPNNRELFWGRTYTELLEPAQLVTLGDHQFGTAVVRSTPFAQEVVSYETFGVIGADLVMFSTYATPEGIEAAKAASNTVLSSLSPADYGNWTMLLPSTNFSAAHPSDWTAESLSSGGASYAFLPPDELLESRSVDHGQPFVVVKTQSQTQRMDAPITNLNSFVSELGYEDALEVESTLLPFQARHAVAIADAGRGRVTLLGVAPYGFGSAGSHFLASWTVDRDALASSQVTFERILLSLRPRTVEMLFNPETATPTVDPSIFDDQTWYVTAVSSREMGEFGPISAETPWPSITFHTGDTPDERRVTITTECATVERPFSIPVEFTLKADIEVEVDFDPSCSADATARSEEILNLFSSASSYSEQGYLILRGTQAALLLRQEQPGSLYPYATDELAALDPLLLQFIVQQRLSYSGAVAPAERGIGPLDTIAYRVSRSDTTFDVFVYDEVSAAEAAAAEISGSNFTGPARFWQFDRYLVQWAGSENYDLESLLFGMMGDPIGVGTEAEDLLRDGQLSAHSWALMTILRTDGTQFSPDVSSDVRYPSLGFKAQSRDGELMANADIICMGSSYRYTIEYMGTAMGEPSRMQLSAEYQPPASEVNPDWCNGLNETPFQPLGQVEYVVAGRRLFMLMPNGDLQIFAPSNEMGVLLDAGDAEVLFSAEDAPDILATFFGK